MRKWCERGNDIHFRIANWMQLNWEQGTLQWSPWQIEEISCDICPGRLPSHKLRDTGDRFCVRDNKYSDLCFKDNCMTVRGMVKINSV